MRRQLRADSVKVGIKKVFLIVFRACLYGLKEVLLKMPLACLHFLAYVIKNPKESIITLAVYFQKSYCAFDISVACFDTLQA